MNEKLIEGIADIIMEAKCKKCALNNKNCLIWDTCFEDAKYFATAIAERLVVDEEKVFEIAQKGLNAQGEYDLIICDGLAKDISKNKPIKVKEEK